MRKLLLSFMIMLMGISYSQTPIIRLKQSREYKSPKFWWRNQVTHPLRTYLADAPSTPAYKNNNFDAWRDSVMTIAVTLDDNNADVSAFRLDLVFDNDIFIWDNTTLTGHDSTRVEKGAYLSNWVEGDNAENGHHYSYEVTWYNNVGYVDSIQTSGQEKSAANNRYDWLRITMVSHNAQTHTFGASITNAQGQKTNGSGTQTELIKLHFKVKDVADNFAPKSFRVATKYEGAAGYYTYVTNGNYLTSYKVYIDGNVGTHQDGIGHARGDITLHPKLLDVEGYFRYAQGNGRGMGAVWDYDDGAPAWERGPIENTYPYWKVKFELDHNEANFSPRITNWLNYETTANHAGANAAAKKLDEGTTDDVIGDHSSTFQFNKKAANGTVSTAEQTLPGEGFLGISYYDSTYTDDKGYYNIQLPRNNRYRISFWPPDESDFIETHDHFDVNRGAITNVSDAIASFNFQSNKHKNYNTGNRDTPGTRIDTLTALEYLVGDVDGDDLFQLNDTYILWSYVSGIMSDYTHHTGRTHEDWSSIDNFNGNNTSYTYYQTVNGQSRPQKYEFTVYWDETTIAEKSRLDRTSENPNYFTNNSAGWQDSLKAPMTVTKKLLNNDRALQPGPIEILNPLMNDLQTGLDTLHLVLGAGYSEWHKDRLHERTGERGNPDYLMPDIGYYFTGDINMTGTKVHEVDDSKTGRATTGHGHQTTLNGSANIDYTKAQAGTVSDGYIDVEGSTFYRWGNSSPAWHLNKINDTNDDFTNNTTNNTLNGVNDVADFEGGLIDVILSLPADSTVRVQSGNQIEVPLTITPREGVLIAGFEFEVEYKLSEGDSSGLEFIDMKTDVLPGPWMTYVNVHEPKNGWQRISFGGMDYSPSNAPQTYHITKETIGLKLVFKATFPEYEWTTAPIRFVGKHAAGNPSGRDLSMKRKDGEVLVWNKYWAFGGGKPDEEAMTYNYPNPFEENTTFQFYLDESKDVKLYILNSIGQRVGTLLDQHILAGLHTFEFTNKPSVFLPGVSSFENHQKLEPGVYIFVLQTDNRIKANKFTVVK